MIEEIKRWVGTVHALINLNILRVILPSTTMWLIHASRDLEH